MLKKISIYLLVACTSISTLFANFLPVLANDTNAKVDYEENSLVIGNEFLTRTLDIADNKISLGKIENKRINQTLTPQEGSELFVIHGNEVKEEPESNVIDRTNWTGYVSNKDDNKTLDDISGIIDGNDNTIIDCWGKQYENGFPINLTFDLGEEQQFQSFSYQKRPGYTDESLGINGTIGKYTFQISRDGSNWTDVKDGEFQAADYNLHKEGNLFNVGDLVHANLDAPQSARYIRLVMKSGALSDDLSLTGAEFNLYKGIYQEEQNDDGPVLKASDLTVQKVSQEPTEKGIKAIVTFEPYEYENVNWNINYVTTMSHEDFYMRSYLEISVDDPNKAVIDYIDMDAIVLGEDAIDVWHHPAEEDIFTERLGAYELTLGQPIYATGMFFGSEFPAADTDVENQMMQIRYFSGKSFEQLDNDGKISDGVYTSWANVVGAAEGTDKDVVQTFLFQYIEEIATRTDFRKQFNSWYDNMMAIDDTSIEKSFYEVEESLAKQGIEPLDAYVVDDGWNNYRAPGYSNPDQSDSGKENNRTGFWEFNDKFKNELYPSSEIANKLNSTYGLWLGPQGGYKYFGGFASYLESQGTGFAQDSEYWHGKAICAGSNRYLDNLTKMFVDYQNRFDISYWKLDGFSVNPCKNEKHDHMSGGYRDMYYTSELWEKNIIMFSKMRQERKSKGKDLYLNATSYVNPSPWLLQWVNAIYTQDAWDLWLDDTQGGSQADQAMTYRDNVYFNFIKVNELQFPLKNIYNHDPIYGVSAGLDFTDDEFRKYMFENATRGTGFWELYFSPSIFNDAKWKITADVLDWAENDFYVLKNAKLFGETPTKGNVYGYSAWNKDEGVVSFRNPTSSEKSYALKLDELVGVTSDVQNVSRVSIYPYANGLDSDTYSYGDTLNVTLQPYETLIYRFGSKDNTAPKLVSAKIKDTNTVEIVFDERVSDDVEIKINNQASSAKLMDDYRTFKVNCNDLEDSASLEISGIKDIFGNAAADVKEPIKTANAVAKAGSKDDLNEDVIEYETRSDGKVMMDLQGKSYKIADKGIDGNRDFSVSMAITTTENNATLLKQGEDFNITIDQEGYVNFTVKGQIISSKESITTVTEKAYGTFNTEDYVETQTQDKTIGKVNDGNLHVVNASRELNGILKLYVDGRLCSSLYDKENLNIPLEGSAVTVGSAEYVGYIGAVEVANSASYYSNAQAYAKDFMINVNETNILRDDWTAEACSEANSYSDGGAAEAIDGEVSTYWHTNYNGTDPCADRHYISIDFGKTTSFDNLTYLARPGAGNGTWTNATVIGINEDGNETTLVEGQEISLTNNAYVFAFDKTQAYKAVRFEVKGTNGHASAAEIYASMNLEKLATNLAMELKNEAQKLYDEVDSETYTEDSYKQFDNAVQAIKKANPFMVTEDNVTALQAALNKAYLELTCDKSALTNLIAEVKKLNENLYTTDSWNNLKTVLTDAETIERLEKPTSDQIEKAITSLTEAKDNLVIRVTEAKFNSLKDAVDKLAAMESSYNTGEFAEAKETIEKAYEMLKKGQKNISEKEAQNMLNEIAEVKENLIHNPCLELLRLMISEANNILESDEIKDADSELVQALKDAVTVGQKLIDKNSTDKTIINTAVNNIDKAMQLLNINISKKQLENLIVTAENLNKDLYTESSYQAVENALIKAKTLLDDKDATIEEINDAYYGLLNAINMLEVKVDKTALKKQINIAEEILSNKNKYIASSLNGLKEALRNAKEVYANKDAGIKDIDTALNAMIKEISETRLKADKSGLGELIKKAEKINLEAYSNANRVKFSNALNKAYEIFKKEEATQEEIDAAIQALEDTISILNKEKPITEKVNTGIQENPLGLVFGVLFSAGILVALLEMKKRKATKE